MIELEKKYTNSQLEKIRDQGVIYMCACPSQVSVQIANLRLLFDYQRKCVAKNESYINDETHRCIAKATAQAHKVMEECLEEILNQEKWDLETLEMPENLRQLMMEIAEQ